MGKESLKEKIVNHAGDYSEKIADKADKYLGDTPDAAKKRAELQSKLKKAGNFLKKIKNPENDQIDIEK